MFGREPQYLANGGLANWLGLNGNNDKNNSIIAEQQARLAQESAALDASRPANGSYLNYQANPNATPGFEQRHAGFLKGAQDIRADLTSRESNYQQNYLGNPQQRAQAAGNTSLAEPTMPAKPAAQPMAQQPTAQSQMRNGPTSFGLPMSPPPQQGRVMGNGDRVINSFDSNGNVQRFAQGGVVGMHPGGPKGTDTVPAWLTPGEAVLNKGAVQMMGKDQINQLNNQGLGLMPQQKASSKAMMGNYHDGSGQQAQYHVRGTPGVEDPGISMYDTEDYQSQVKQNEAPVKSKVKSVRYDPPAATTAPSPKPAASLEMPTVDVNEQSGLTDRQKNVVAQSKQKSLDSRANIDQVNSRAPVANNDPIDFAGREKINVTQAKAEQAKRIAAEKQGFGLGQKQAPAADPNVVEYTPTDKAKYQAMQNAERGATPEKLAAGAKAAEEAGVAKVSGGSTESLGTKAEARRAANVVAESADDVAKGASKLGAAATYGSKVVNRAGPILPTVMNVVNDADQLTRSDVTPEDKAKLLANDVARGAIEGAAGWGGAMAGAAGGAALGTLLFPGVGTTVGAVGGFLGGLGGGLGAGTLASKGLNAIGAGDWFGADKVRQAAPPKENTPVREGEYEGTAPAGYYDEYNRSRLGFTPEEYKRYQEGNAFINDYQIDHPGASWDKANAEWQKLLDARGVPQDAAPERGLYPNRYDPSKGLPPPEVKMPEAAKPAANPQPTTPQTGASTEPRDGVPVPNEVQAIPKPATDNGQMPSATATPINGMGLLTRDDARQAANERMIQQGLIKYDRPDRNTMGPLQQGETAIQGNTAAISVPGLAGISSRNVGAMDNVMDGIRKGRIFMSTDPAERKARADAEAARAAEHQRIMDYYHELGMTEEEKSQKYANDNARMINKLTHDALNGDAKALQMIQALKGKGQGDDGKVSFQQVGTGQFFGKNMSQEHKAPIAFNPDGSVANAGLWSRDLYNQSRSSALQQAAPEFFNWGMWSDKGDPLNNKGPVDWLFPSANDSEQQAYATKKASRRLLNEALAAGIPLNAIPPEYLKSAELSAEELTAYQ